MHYYKYITFAFEFETLPQKWEKREK